MFLASFTRQVSSSSLGLPPDACLVAKIGMPCTKMAMAIVPATLWGPSDFATRAMAASKLVILRRASSRRFTAASSAQLQES